MVGSAEEAYRQQGMIGVKRPLKSQAAPETCLGIAQSAKLYQEDKGGGWVTCLCVLQGLQASPGTSVETGYVTETQEGY